MGVVIARGWRARRAEVSIFPREPARASPRRKDSPARAPWEPGRGGTNPRCVWPEPGERARSTAAARLPNRSNDIKHGLGPYQTLFPCLGAQFTCAVYN
jgi:hypothetical protein